MNAVGADPAYAQVLGYIHGLYRFGSRLGLSRQRRLLAALGDPHLGLRVIHVAGTNGKGSVAAMLASVLTAAGYRTGLYISPYIEEFSERISVDGLRISPAETVRLVEEEVRPASEGLAATGRDQDQVTEFEFVTALGFVHFARRAVDFVVLEVGLGGRFDATNVVDRPLLSVITSIGLDHMDRLGPTVRDIAAEKAAIIKRSSPVVSAPQCPEALSVIAAAAARRDAPLYLAGRDGKVELVSFSPTGQDIVFRGPSFPEVTGLRLPLLGPHQLDNAATALTAAGVLRLRGQAPSLNAAALREGLAATVWPGRFEIFGDSPPVVVDGAHNAPGARALAEALRRCFPGRPIVLVLGVLADKDVDALLSFVLPPALPEVVSVVTCEPASPRAMPAAALAERIRGLHPGLTVTVSPTVEKAVAGAVAAAVTAAPPGPRAVVCVAGSLYQVGHARAAARAVAGRGPARRGEVT
ncbi:MAG: bifunctional folylpolyglutamate synthase/dihydrofolate synthase [Bacillota bacterium]|nr:MAG: bifunctional folylpolyglutamate synthase/dihydrofolate synthase [Bacillota bacterium]